MILERLRLRAFGPFNQPLELPGEGVFDRYLNIIAGDNEAGKTTLFNALHHVLFTPYRSSGADVENLRPWGTDLSPTVEVEFCIGEQKYRVRKRFLSEPSCLLSEWRDGQYFDISEGDSADERVRRFFLGERPGRGAARTEHRGLARLLWIPQGDVLLPDLDGELRQRVEASLGVITLDGWENQLVTVGASRYSQFWTGTGKITKGSGLPQKQQEIMELERQCREMEQEMLDLEQYGVDLEGYRQNIGHLQEEKRQAEEKMRQLDNQIAAIAKLEGDIKEARALLKHWESEFVTRHKRKEQLTEAKKQLERAKDQLEAVAVELGTLQEKINSTEGKKDELEKSLEKGKLLVKEAEGQMRTAQRLLRAKDLEADLARLMIRLQKAENLAQQLEEKRKELGGMPNPNEKIVSRARNLELDLVKLGGQLEAVGVSITFSPASPRRGLFVADGDRQEAFYAEKGRTLSFRAGRSAKVDLEDVGSLDIHSGAVEVAEIERTRDAAREELRDLLAKFSATSADQLEQMRIVRARAEDGIKNLGER